MKGGDPISSAPAGLCRKINIVAKASLEGAFLMRKFARNGGKVSVRPTSEGGKERTVKTVWHFLNEQT